MSEAIALAERIAGRELAIERHGAAAGDVRRTRAGRREGTRRARLGADDRACGRAPRPVGVGRC